MKKLISITIILLIFIVSINASEKLERTKEHHGFIKSYTKQMIEDTIKVDTVSYYRIVEINHHSIYRDDCDPNEKSCRFKDHYKRKISYHPNLLYIICKTYYNPANQLKK